MRDPLRYFGWGGLGSAHLWACAGFRCRETAVAYFLSGQGAYVFRLRGGGRGWVCGRVGLRPGGWWRGLPTPLCGGGSACGNRRVVHLVVVGATGDPGAAGELGAQTDGGGWSLRLLAYRGDLQELEQFGRGVDGGGFDITEAGGAGADGGTGSHWSLLVHAVFIKDGWGVNRHGVVERQAIVNTIACLQVTVRDLHALLHRTGQVGGGRETSELFRSGSVVRAILLLLCSHHLQALTGCLRQWGVGGCWLLVGFILGALFRRGNRLCSALTVTFAYSSCRKYMALGGGVGFRRTTDMVAWLWRTVRAPLAV